MFRASFTYGLVFLALFSCGYRVEKEPTDKLNMSGAGLDKMGYADVQSQVLQTKCATCHAWATADKYDLVFGRIADIQSNVTSGAMPKANSPTGPLTATEKEILLSWIARGAPRDSITGTNPPAQNPGNPPAPTPGPGPAPSPTPSPSPCIVNPTNPGDPCIGFAEVQAKVLQPKCATCHTFPGSYSATFAKLSMIQSHVSGGVMPPQRAAQLTDFERNMVLSWIARGAPEVGSNNPNAPTPAPNPPAPPAPNPPCECMRHGGHCVTNFADDRRGGDCLN